MVLTAPYPDLMVVEVVLKVPYSDQMVAEVVQLEGEERQKR